MEEDNDLHVLVEPSRIIDFKHEDETLMTMTPPRDSGVDIPRVDEVITLPDGSEWRVGSVNRRYTASDEGESVYITVGLKEIWLW